MAAHDLPFGAACTPSGDLGTIVEAFLGDPEPGVVTWSALEDAGAGPEPPPGRDVPLPVWVSDVGTVAH